MGYTSNFPLYEIAATDKNGRFTFDRLPPLDNYVIMGAEAADHEGILHHEGMVTVTAEETTNLGDIQLIKGSIVTGRIADAETGEPIVETAVRIHAENNKAPFNMLAYGITDENGRFTLRTPPVEVRIHVEPPQGYMRPYQPKTISIPADTTLDIGEIKLSKGIVINGIVFDRDGKPITDAIIEGRVRNGYSAYTAKTDSSGRFTLSGITQFNSITITATQSEKKLRGSIETDSNNPKEIKIVCDPYETTTVSGRIINENGEPVQGISIYFIKEIWILRNFPQRSPKQTAMGNSQ